MEKTTISVCQNISNIAGHRVTLTWNIYFHPAVELPEYPPSMPSALVCLKTLESEQALKAALNLVLSDSNFLREGGNLGFGLRQEYPLNPDVGLGNLIDCLKGSDAIIQSVCHQLSLTTSLRIIYETEQKEGHGDFVMIDHFFEFPRWKPIEVLSYEMEGEGGSRFSTPSPVSPNGYNYYGSNDSQVVWVTDLAKYTRTKTAYLAQGNEACLGYVYCTVCLIVSIGPFGNRTAKPIKKKNRYLLPVQKFRDVQASFRIVNVKRWKYCKFQSGKLECISCRGDAAEAEL